MKGIYGVLERMPVWITSAGLFTFFNIVIFGGRDLFEGIPYNVSRCAQYGDNALIIAILIACAILQDTGYIPKIFNSWRTQCLLAAGLFLIGLATHLYARATSVMGSIQVVDVSHSVFFVPAFLFLLIMLLPITFIQGGWKQKSITILCFAVWIMFLVSDISEGRLDQILWMKAHGLNFVSLR